MKNLLVAVGTWMFAVNATAAQDPQAVYDRTCSACHAGQLPQAPRKGDKAAWEPRLAKGLDTLVMHVTDGFNAMPPRGLCTNCNTEDYRAVIQWMSR